MTLPCSLEQLAQISLDTCDPTCNGWFLTFSICNIL